MNEKEIEDKISELRSELKTERLDMSFEEITVKGLGDPTIFSNGIGIALITTIAGIIVAIPHQIAYNHFIAMIDNIELEAKKELVGNN